MLSQQKNQLYVRIIMAHSSMAKYSIARLNADFPIGEVREDVQKTSSVKRETVINGAGGSNPVSEPPDIEHNHTATGWVGTTEIGAGESVASDNPEAILDFVDISANGFIDPTAGVTRLTEEYQQIKRRVIGNTVDGLYEGPAASNLIMVTSSVPNEGKTFTSINLALSIAMEVDRSVVVVDTDIVKSDLTRFFGLVNRPGLYDILGHPELGIADVICKTNVPSLSVIPAGTDTRGVTEKVASTGMRELTLELSKRYTDRLVIFDSPPILATSSARAMAGYVGQTILVVEACRTPAHTVRHSMAVMEPLNFAGVILNKSRYSGGDSNHYYGYGYGYGYGHDTDQANI